MMEGQAMVVLPIMWTFVGVVFLFVGLRLYTRIHLIDSLGSDDHAYTASSVLLLISTVFIHVAAQFGFGQGADNLSDDDAARAKMWEMIGISVAFMAMAAAKWSFGLFLLRFVVNRWQRMAIWCIISVLLLLCAMTDILFWLQCLPSKSIYDPRVEGTCHIKIIPCLTFMGSWGVFADMYLTIVPWCCIWSISMTKPQRVTIIGSMSLGVLASICGMVRNIKIDDLNDKDYINSTTGFVVWTAAEVFATLISIGIPILRPLLARCFPEFWLFKKSTRKQSSDLDFGGPGAFAMHTIGGSIMSGAMSPGEGDQKIVRGPIVRAEVSGQFGNASDESIFWHPDIRRSIIRLQKPAAVRIRDDVRVEFAPEKVSEC